MGPVFFRDFFTLLESLSSLEEFAMLTHTREFSEVTLLQPDVDDQIRTIIIAGMNAVKAFVINNHYALAYIISTYDVIRRCFNL